MKNNHSDKPYQVSKDFLIRINDVYKRVRLDEVFYLGSEGKYVSIVVENRKYSFRSSLKNLEAILPENFSRIHTSYIVNLDRVVGIKLQNNLVMLSNGIELSFSRTYKETLFEHFLLG